jgi:hypothetical protein
MSDLWETWVSDQTVDEFLADADDLIAEGAFPDRRAAFLAYAGYVFSGLEFAEDGLSAAKLGDLLLAHASAVERRGRGGRLRSQVLLTPRRPRNTGRASLRRRAASAGPDRDL